MNICYFPSDLSGAGMLRCLVPGNELEKQFGYHCFTTEYKMVKPGIYGFTIDKMPYADIYVLQQRPERHWLTLIPQLQNLGSIVVCETDDNYLHIPHNHPARKALTNEQIKTLHRVYGLADALTVSTPYLADQYKEFNDRVECLPNFLEQSMWENLQPRSWDRLRIGWQGVSDIRMWDLRILQGIIGPFLRKHPEIDFVAAGDPLVHDILDVPEGQRISYEKVLWHGTPEITNTMDIGLVPLELNPFNEAKSDLKGKEYNACGIPYVASSSSSYMDWTEVGKNGFLARRPRDWTRHLELLCSDHTLREQMGAYGRTKVERYWIQDNVYLWNDLYTELAGDRADQLMRTAIVRGAIQKPPEFSGFLRYLLELPPLTTIVEIGTAQGGTFGALCEIAAEDALIISIDLPGGDFGGTVEDVYGERDTKKMAGYAKKGQRVEFIQADSHDPATKATLDRILDGRTVDLLFIDGDHTYMGVKRDYELYSPIVTDSTGLVCFHDISHHTFDDRIEVEKFWSEVKNGKEYREFIAPGYERGWGSWGGIGVLE